MTAERVRKICRMLKNRTTQLGNNDCWEWEEGIRNASKQKITAPIRKNDRGEYAQALRNT